MKERKRIKNKNKRLFILNNFGFVSVFTYIRLTHMVCAMTRNSMGSCLDLFGLLILAKTLHCAQIRMEDEEKKKKEGKERREQTISIDSIYIYREIILFLSVVCVWALVLANFYLICAATNIYIYKRVLCAHELDRGIRLLYVAMICRVPTLFFFFGFVVWQQQTTGSSTAHLLRFPFITWFSINVRCPIKTTNTRVLFANTTRSVDDFCFFSRALLLSSCWYIM